MSSVDVSNLSHDELVLHVEQKAQKLLHVSTFEAFRMLDESKLNGTAAKAIFQGYRHLLSLSTHLND